MFEMTQDEMKEIDSALEGKLKWAKERNAETEQLAMDASRLLSCTEARLQEYAGQGFFKRCWYQFTGKTGSLERIMQSDLISMQKYAWRYINLLQERDLMLAHSMIVVKNNLRSLAFDQNILKSEVGRLADKVYKRFTALEQRVDNHEASQRIHSWLLTIETHDYNERYPEGLRLLRVVNDFYLLKAEFWSMQELRYLESAIRSVNIDPRKRISISEFVDQIIDEIHQTGYDEFSSLIEISFDDRSKSDVVIDSISSPIFNAIYQIKDNYTISSRVIRSLQRRLEISHPEAVKAVLKDFIDEMGIETGTELPFKDLATEILACLSLSRRLLVPPRFNFPVPPPPDICPVPPTPDPVPPPLDISHRKFTKERIDPWAEVRRYLREYPVMKDLYKLNEIPLKKLIAARTSMLIPAEEDVVCLVDSTLFGSCSEGIAIGRSGVYWKNSFENPRHCIWGEIIKNKKSIIASDGNLSDSELLLLGCRISLAGSSVAAANIKAILINISTTLDIV
jgi:hypothetical protein